MIVEHDRVIILGYITPNGLKITNNAYSNDMYGYDKVDGYLVVNDKEQKMISKIIKLYKKDLL